MRRYTILANKKTVSAAATQRSDQAWSTLSTTIVIRVHLGRDDLSMRLDSTNPGKREGPYEYGKRLGFDDVGVIEGL